MQSAETVLTIPKEYLKADGGLNPNVLMFLTAIMLIAMSVCGYWLWSWPNWICFIANVFALHLSGTVIHDASHNAAHRNRTLNAILGHGSALMLGFAFPVFTRVHLQHHAHVNDQ
jgi:beta-carotene hydroxylase